MTNEPLDSLIVLTTGKQDRGTRATLAFSWACTAAAMGKKTAIYLTMDGTLWALKETAHGVKVDGFEPLEEYIAQFDVLGGSLLVCAPCSEYYCSFDRELLGKSLLTNCQIVGLSTVVAKIGPATSVVSF